MKKSLFILPKLTYCLLIPALLIGISSCTDPAPSNASSGDQLNENKPTTEETVVDTTPALPPPDCAIQGQVLDGNTLWMPEMDVIAVIKADESTTQEGFEPSHRLLELLDGRSCEVKFTKILPENTSPDYPYYIAQIQYNKGSHLLGIRGYYDIFVCDLDRNNKLSKLSPEYFSERLFDDPQSGMITRLEVWEDYLLGHAQDVGAFAFDLSDKTTPKAVIPFAEWQDPESGQYHSLFLLPTEGGYQAIIPFYDANEDSFSLHPIFEQPQDLSLNIPKSARNNEFLVVRNTNNADIYAIHLGQRALINLPEDISKLKTQAILKWLKTQGK